MIPNSINYIILRTFTWYTVTGSDKIWCRTQPIAYVDALFLVEWHVISRLARKFESGLIRMQAPTIPHFSCILYNPVYIDIKVSNRAGVPPKRICYWCTSRMIIHLDWHIPILQIPQKLSTSTKFVNAHVSFCGLKISEWQLWKYVSSFSLVDILHYIFVMSVNAIQFVWWTMGIVACIQHLPKMPGAGYSLIPTSHAVSISRYFGIQN